MRRPALAAALCLLVVLAGCSFGSTPTATRTPDGLTAETAPPGVEAAGGKLVEPATLLSAHASALESSGFVLTVRTNATVARDGGTARVQRRQLVRAEPGLARYNTTVLNPGSRFDVWGNESVQAVRVRTGGSVQYRVGEPQSAARLTGRSLLSRYLSAGDWRVTAVERREGETLVTLRSTAVPTADGALPAGARSVRNYAAVMVVDTDGRVRLFEATADYTVNGADGSFRLRQQVRSLSGPEVARPGWLAEALAS